MATGDNPPRNSLGPGISEPSVLSAIQRSGYPVQTAVAEILRAEFEIHAEWSYLDRDTKALRAIDLFATKALFDWKYPNSFAVRPELALMIECKKSDLPFVFFEAAARPWMPEFPIITGLKSSELTLYTDDALSTHTVPVLTALGLTDNPYLIRPPVSATFAKCNRKGSELELSGDEAYNNVVLPLVKSVAHLEKVSKPKESHLFFDARLTIPLAVVDAPIVLVTSDNGVRAPRLTPWVRLSRHEYDASISEHREARIWALDVVHVDYLTEYVTTHLMPFAELFAQRAKSHHRELADGEGFAAGLEHDSFNKIENRLRPRPVTHSMLGGRWLSLPRVVWNRVRKSRKVEEHCED